MSELTHKQLVEIGRKWLSGKSPIVFAEISSCNEEPDILGVNCNIKLVKNKIESHNYGSVLIECKASRSDFKGDAKKSFRRMPTTGIGQYRYYLAPQGLIQENEIPYNWGLLEVDKKRIKIIKMALPYMEYNLKNEMRIMISAMRRLKIEDGNHCSIRVYNRETKNRASITIENETDPKNVQ